MKAVELFTGAGGLAMGMMNAGFEHSIALELDSSACATIRNNHFHSARKNIFPIHEIDVRKFCYKSNFDINSVDVVAGGPPCQPFSLAGNHKGLFDSRDMFPEAVRAVRELKPKAFIFENVKGLLRNSFSEYFEYILLQLTYPQIQMRKDESWLEHLSRLERHHTSKPRSKLDCTYNVIFRLVNAADYGIPQKRDRVFIVGFRADLNIGWSFPKPTHSAIALIHDQWITKNYWKRHNLRGKEIPPIPLSVLKNIDKIRSETDAELLTPWKTLRDALVGLPVPTLEANSSFANHIYVPGARKYPGHTGSILDEPAKTLKAGSHGVPGGENMIAFYDGSVRYFTVREAARIQTFPDNYVFSQTWTNTMKQLGNAVPVQLAEVIATSVANALKRN